MHDITLIWQYESPFERDWIRFLLGGFFVHEVTDCSYRLVAENSVVIMSSRRHVPHSYITKLMQTRRCVLYHISDESFHGRYEDYVAFDFVFRNFGSAVFETDGIKVLPLGYTAGMRVEGARRRATERRYIWCFVGALKASRAEALRALTGAYQGFVHIGGSGGTRRIDRPSYRQILEDSVFCPCPMGNVNLETARFYDALEAGCIPIVETRPTMRCYETLFRELPVPKVAILAGSVAIDWRSASRSGRPRREATRDRRLVAGAQAPAAGGGDPDRRGVLFQRQGGKKTEQSDQAAGSGAGMASPGTAPAPFPSRGAAASEAGAQSTAARHVVSTWWDILDRQERNSLIYVEAKTAKVPAIGFGTYQMRGDGFVNLLRYALEVGYRHIDTAAQYRNETEIGRAIRESGIAREEIFLATKVRREDLGRDAARRSLEGSLQRLGTDYVDLLLMHWPNDAVPLGETLDAFAELKAAGKARHIGVCNFTVPLLVQAVEEHGADLLTNQVEYHVLLSQDAVLRYLGGRGMLLTAHSPLAAGVSPMRPNLARAGRRMGRGIRHLSGGYAKPFVKMMRDWLLKPRGANTLGRPSIPRHPVLARIGAPHGKSAAQVALRWLIEQDGVAAIPRATKERECRENLDIFDFTLTAEDRMAIAALAGDYRVVDQPTHRPGVLHRSVFPRKAGGLLA